MVLSYMPNPNYNHAMFEILKRCFDNVSAEFLIVGVFCSVFTIIKIIIEIKSIVTSHDFKASLKNTPRIYKLHIFMFLYKRESIWLSFFYEKGCHWGINTTFEGFFCVVQTMFFITQGTSSVKPKETLRTEPTVSNFMNTLSTNAKEKHTQGKLNDYSYRIEWARC